MSKRIPPLNSLKVFEAAARHLSFRRAADELHVTPAAVSHQLSQLEAFLGIRLFHRHAHGIQLTPAAKLSLPKLQEGFRCLQESVDQIRSNADARVLTIACTPSLSMCWLMPRLHRFVLGHPGIDVQVQTYIGPLVRQSQTRKGTPLGEAMPSADMFIAYGDGNYAGFEVEQLLEVFITPMCSPALLERSPLNTAADLNGHVLLHDDREALYGNHSFWRAWSEAAGLDTSMLANGHHFTHAQLALGAALEGTGVVATTPVLATSELRSGTLVAPFDLQVRVESAYHMLVASRTQRPGLDALQEWLRTEAASTLTRAPAMPR